MSKYSFDFKKKVVMDISMGKADGSTLLKSMN